MFGSPNMFKNIFVLKNNLPSQKIQKSFHILNSYKKDTGLRLMVLRIKKLPTRPDILCVTFIWISATHSEPKA